MMHPWGKAEILIRVISLRAVSMHVFAFKGRRKEGENPDQVHFEDSVLISAAFRYSVEHTAPLTASCNVCYVGAHVIFLTME